MIKPMILKIVTKKIIIVNNSNTISNKKEAEKQFTSPLSRAHRIKDLFLEYMICCLFVRKVILWDSFHAFIVTTERRVLS